MYEQNTNEIQTQLQLHLRNMKQILTHWLKLMITFYKLFDRYFSMLFKINFDKLVKIYTRSTVSTDTQKYIYLTTSSNASNWSAKKYLQKDAKVPFTNYVMLQKEGQ